MTKNNVRIQIDPIRSLAQASITNSYAAIGTPLTHPVRILCITNNTDGDMLISTDGSTNMLFIPKSSFRLYDICTNRQLADPGLYFAIGTQFYIKYSSAPSTGAVYIECMWAE